jgi:hypothetical protein
MENMPADLKRLDEPAAYNGCWRRTYDLACSLYDTEQFRENLRMFYRPRIHFSVTLLSASRQLACNVASPRTNCRPRLLTFSPARQAALLPGIRREHREFSK